MDAIALNKGKKAEETVLQQVNLPRPDIYVIILIHTPVAMYWRRISIMTIPPSLTTWKRFGVLRRRLQSEQLSKHKILINFTDAGKLSSGDKPKWISFPLQPHIRNKIVAFAGIYGLFI